MHYSLRVILFYNTRNLFQLYTTHKRSFSIMLHNYKFQYSKYIRDINLRHEIFKYLLLKNIWWNRQSNTVFGNERYILSHIFCNQESVYLIYLYLFCCEFSKKKLKMLKKLNYIINNSNKKFLNTYEVKIQI